MRGVTLDAFEADIRKRWLVERGVEIISEGSRRLPDDLKQRHPEIPWPKVAGIGNVLRHDYEDIAAPIMWKLVHDDLPVLEAACRAELAAAQVEVAVIRNNCFGHINREQEVLDMFSKAALTPDEIRELMDLSESLLNDISLAQRGSVHAFDLDSRHDTIRLLDDLNGLVRRRKALRSSVRRRPTA